MSDPMAAAVQFLADQLDLPSHVVSRALEAAEAAGVLEVRLVEVEHPQISELDEIRARGRGKCLCPIATIERVLVRGGSCGRGGCPYGGDA